MQSDLIRRESDVIQIDNVKACFAACAGSLQKSRNSSNLTGRHLRMNKKQQKELKFGAERLAHRPVRLTKESVFNQCKFYCTSCIIVVLKIRSSNVIAK